MATKIVNLITTKYHLVGGSVTYEDNGKDRIHYTYDSSGKLISMNLNGAEYYYVRNAQGDIIGLINAQGEKVVSYTYDSWGDLISIEGSLKDTVGEKNPYRYRGYRYDSETGLYYLQNRYYNPEWGRFINADGIIGETGELLSHNIFAYCNNNFVNFNDPSGYLCCSANYEYGGGGGGAIAIPLVSGGLKDCLKGLGYGAIGTIKAIGAATVGVTVKAIASNERSKKQHAVYAVRNKGKVIYIGRTKQGVKKRFKQHIRKNRFSKKCDVVTLYDNLNYYQARGIEQIAYEYYLAKGNDMKNKIQPISPSNIKKDLYMKAGTAHIIMWDGGAVLRENE